MHTLSAKSIAVSDGEAVVLRFLEQKRPNSVRLYVEHPTTIFFKKHGLIIVSAVSLNSNFNSYVLTEKGVLVARKVMLYDLSHISESDQLEHLKEITGQDLSIFIPRLS